MKETKETSENVVFTEISSSIKEAGKNLHGLSTPHRSETKGVAERAVHRVKEGTAIARVQSELPEEWWDCAMECCCSFKKRYGQTFDGQSHSFWNIG